MGRSKGKGNFKCPIHRAEQSPSHCPCCSHSSYRSMSVTSGSTSELTAQHSGNRSRLEHPPSPGTTMMTCPVLYDGVGGQRERSCLLKNGAGMHGDIGQTDVKRMTGNDTLPLQQKAQGWLRVVANYKIWKRSRKTESFPYD